MQVKGWQPFVKVLIQSYLFSNIVIIVILILLIKILLAVLNNESVLCGLAWPMVSLAPPAYRLGNKPCMVVDPSLYIVY